MSTTRRRNRKPRFYWAELGFLLLGLIGLRPEIITELLPTRNNNYPPTHANQLQPLAGYPPYYQQPAAYQQPVAYQPQLAYQQPVHNPQSINYANSPYPTTNPTYYAANTYQQPQSRIANLPTTYPTPNNNSTVAPTSSNLTIPNYRSTPPNTPPVVWPEGYAPSTLNPLYTPIPNQQNTYSPVGSGYNLNQNYPTNPSPYPLGRY